MREGCTCVVQTEGGKPWEILPKASPLTKWQHNICICMYVCEVEGCEKGEEGMKEGWKAEEVDNSTY